MNDILHVCSFQVEEETVLRVDLENRLQSLKEELAFKKQMYDEVNKPLTFLSSNPAWQAN